MSVDGVNNPTSGTQATDQTGGTEEQKPTGTTPSSSKSTKAPSTLGKMREESPEVYKKMLEAMFQECSKQNQKHERRMAEIRRKGQG